MKRALTATLTLTLAVVFVGVVGARRADAHAELIDASPAPDAVLADAPSEVVLVFSETVQFAVDPLTVTTSDNRSVVQGDPVLDPDTVITATLEPIDPGVFSVAYRVISDDGHVVEGGYQFTLAPPPTTELPTVATTTPGAPQTSAVSVPRTVPGTVPSTTPATTPLGTAAGTTKSSKDSPFGLALVALAAVVGAVGGLTAWLMSRRGQPPT